MSQSNKTTHGHNSKTKLGLTLAALGVVYGDIGTSPIYAVSQIFFGSGGLSTSTENVLGAISLIIYALTIVVAFKYVLFVLQANNKGDGGVFALYALLSKYKDKPHTWAIPVMLVVLTLSAGLLFGDGLITPAISVLSAVEGMAVLADSLEKFIIPITVILLLGLFLIQSKGTSKVGKVFGPIIIIWFISIASMGVRGILMAPSIVNAINPIHAFYVLFHLKLTQILFVLGFVMLSITGGEALFADMGHFGAKPIRIGWFAMVYPALILNYLGQGGYLLSGALVQKGDIFYSLVPKTFLVPMIILATLATIIASQALISGAFSLTSQASALGVLPQIRKKYTDKDHEGQIYVPFINWALCLGCIFLVFMFRSSSNLASAYGLAVAGDMLVTSLAMILIARHHWGWKDWQTYSLFIPLAIIDLGFFTSNMFKFFEGGFIPFTIGFSIFSLMLIWQWGRERVFEEYKKNVTSKVKEIINLPENNLHVFNKTVIFMTKEYIESEESLLPVSFQLFWDRFHIVPKNIIFLNAQTLKEPTVSGDRFEVVNFKDKGRFTMSTVRINFGYWEESNVEKYLSELSDHKKISIEHDHKEWILYIVQPRIIMDSKDTLFFKKLRMRVFNFLTRNADSADHYLGLGKEVSLSTETVPILLK